MKPCKNITISYSIFCDYHTRMKCENCHENQWIWHNYCCIEWRLCVKCNLLSKKCKDCENT